MPAFEVHLNGKKVCTAGLSGDGVLSAHLSWVRRKASRRAPRLSLHVGGLDSSTWEHLVWHEALPVQIGDEVRIKVSTVARIDAPSARKKPDAVADLRARKSYVRKMARELGWKLVIPK
jgi:hypothetical protein